MLKLFGLLLSSSLAFAQPSPVIEVVESAPVETTLAVPGVRQTQEVWLELFKSAKTRIDLEQFYISDEPGQGLVPVLQAIRDAAARGVQVRIIVDTKFLEKYPETVKELGSRAGIATRIVDFSVTNGVQHAKFFVIDGQRSFAGSQNFDWRVFDHIHEVGLSIDDQATARAMTAIFDKDWAMAAHEADPTPGDLLPSTIDAQVVASPASLNPKGTASTLDQLLLILKEAKQTIKIANMEYTTKQFGTSEKWTVLDTAIRAAAARGVQVQMLLDESDLKKGKADLLALSKLANIQVKIITIPAFSGGPIAFGRLLHTKNLITDQSAWVGSENWSQGYFFQSRNVGVVTHSPAIRETLTKIFDQAWSSAYAKAL